MATTGNIFMGNSYHGKYFSWETFIMENRSYCSS